MRKWAFVMAIIPTVALAAEPAWMDSLRTAVEADSMEVWLSRREVWRAEALDVPEPYDVLVATDESLWPEAPVDERPEFVWKHVRLMALNPPEPIDSVPMALPQRTESAADVWGWALLALLASVWAVREWRKSLNMTEKETSGGQRMEGAEGVMQSEWNQIQSVLQSPTRTQEQVKRAFVNLERIRILFDRVEGKDGGGGGLDLARKLSRNELEVARLLARRLKSAEIAEILDISPGYVYNIRVALRRKLDLKEEDDMELHLRRLLKS